LGYPEIVQLNPHVIGPDNEITTGTALTMPSDATGLQTAHTGRPTAASTTTYVRVEQGDTLWSIEQRVTGSGTNWRDGWQANKDRVEPGGERFTDQNLIRPGWELDIPTNPATGPALQPAASPHTPAASTPTTRQRPAHASGQQPPATPRTDATPTTPRAPATPAPAEAPPGHAGQAPAKPHPQRASTPASTNRYLSLGVGGGLLAASTFAALMVHRRRKFRHRRPGHVVASLPPELIPLEQALVTNGRAALAKMTFLDLALRDLAQRLARQRDGRLPDIAGAGINDDYLELYLAAPAGPPPQPWIATDELRWSLGRGADIDPAAGRRLAPYPCLVSVGYSEDGTEYLLDLEHVGAMHLTGGAQQCLDLARYVVAELANNMWSDHLTVTVAGFGQELIDANPARLAYTDDPHAAAAELSSLATQNRRVATEASIDVLEGRLRGTDGDVWMPHVLLSAPGLLDQDSEMLQCVAGPGRAAVAVVLTSGCENDTAGGQLEVQVAVSESGRLMTSILPVQDITAFALPIEDAPDLARAIAWERDGALDEPTPRSTGDRPWDAFTDVAGALLPEYTVARPAPATVEPASMIGSSVLPGPDELYLSSTATTEQDLAQLAPRVSTETRAAVEKADPELDDLLAVWNNPEAGLAKLHVLGPVRVTAFGRPPERPEAMLTEIVTYLWSQPNGVSTNQYANDLWPNHDYVGTDSVPKDLASHTRLWLGTDPRTGREYMPRARRGGMQGYRIEGLLVDYDLFRRLRVRGEARGADGLADLVAALDLVSGTPLSMRRDYGYEWLPAGDELLYQGAIAEVAHLVATRALECGNDAQTLRACQLALQFDEADDRALLTMIKAHEKAGREAEKEATILRLKTLEDPPARTLEVMRRNGWLARGA
jgi:LysM repeat protein